MFLSNTKSSAESLASMHELGLRDWKFLDIFRRMNSRFTTNYQNQTNSRLKRNPNTEILKYFY